MYDILKRITYLEKLVNRVAFFLMFIFMWVELILVFTEYKTARVLLYEEYGETAMGLYYLSIFVLIFFLFYLSSRIGDLIKDIKSKLVEKEN